MQKEFRMKKDAKEITITYRYAHKKKNQETKQSRMD